MAKKKKHNYKKGKAYKPAVKSKMAKSNFKQSRSNFLSSNETTVKQGNTTTRKKSVASY